MELNTEIKKGNILVSEPFLPDPSFYRTVIQLVEHNLAGTIGFVLNQPSGLMLCDLLDNCLLEIPVYIGGPVQQDTLHMIHKIGEAPEASEVFENVYWSGEFDFVKLMLETGLKNANDVHFFLGYSGWAPQQLLDEMNEKSWILAEGKEEYVFNAIPDLWKQILLDTKNPKFQHLANAPKDINLN